MELQPIVGTPCAHCKDRILVDLDGKNCKRCGLALHRRCARAHRGECANKPAVVAAATDYAEVAPIEWTTRLIVPVAVGAFVLAFGLGMLTSGADGGRDNGKRDRYAWVALVAGALIAAGGYAVERSRQSRPRG